MHGRDTLQAYAFVIFKNYWQANLTLRHQPSLADDRLKRGGPVMRVPGVDSRRLLVGPPVVLAAWIQAIMISDTAPFRNPSYHQLGYTADRLDYERMARVVAGLATVIEHLAGS